MGEKAFVSGILASFWKSYLLVFFIRNVATRSLHSRNPLQVFPALNCSLQTSRSPGWPRDSPHHSVVELYCCISMTGSRQGWRLCEKRLFIESQLGERVGETLWERREIETRAADSNHPASVLCCPWRALGWGEVRGTSRALKELQVSKKGHCKWWSPFCASERQERKRDQSRKRAGFSGLSCRALWKPRLDLL